MGRVLASVMALGIVAFASGAPRPEATGTRTTAHAKPALAVRVEGGHLVSADGKPLLLRGVSVSGLEDYAIQGWAWNSNYTAYEPWGGDRPSRPAILRWHANAVRIPLNEASWLGLTTYDHDGKSRQGRPGQELSEHSGQDRPGGHRRGFVCHPGSALEWPECPGTWPTVPAPVRRRPLNRAS